MVGVRTYFVLYVQSLYTLKQVFIFPEYNPRYFDEPETFKPSRWEGISADSETFTAFSFGAFSTSSLVFCLSFESSLACHDLRPAHMHWPEIRDRRGCMLANHGFARLACRAADAAGRDRRNVVPAGFGCSSWYNAVCIRHSSQVCEEI